MSEIRRDASSRDRRTTARLWTLLALGVAGYFASFAAYPGLFFALGVNHYNVWFLDTFALLASNDAVTRGLDPYAPNPLDYFHRPHVYSHWWLHLRDLGLTRTDAWWLGLALVGAFLIAALARLRPRTGRELAWYAAVLCSSPVLLAVDRANNDLVIFLLLAMVVPSLRAKWRGVRLLAPLLIAVAAALKYYPAAAGLVLLAAPDWKEARARIVIAGMLLALAALSLGQDLTGYGPLAPQPEGLLSFGSTAFANTLGWTGWAPKLLGFLAAAAVVAACWRRRVLENWEPAVERQSDWLYFILGAVLLTGCFFASLNYGYRWIFAIWLAPLLATLPRDSAAPAGVRRLARATGALLLVVLWWDPFCCLVLNRFIGIVPGPTITKWAEYAFLAEQPIDWALFACLLVFLTHFTRTNLARLAGGIRVA